MRNSKRDYRNDGDIFLELQNLSNKLRQSEALKSNFLSNIRNEINNPLSAILGLATLLMNEDENVKRHASMIYQEAFNLNFQLRNIFAAADIEAGEISCKAENVDIEKMLRSIAESFRAKANHKNVRLLLQCNESSKKFCTDSYMLSLILSNLIGNAIEFSFFNNEVIVSCHFDMDKMTITIQDFGMGISEENRHKIFERFYQLDHGTCKQHGGQGLGLSVVKEFVEILKGELMLKSAEQKGTSFTITLPAMKDSVSNKDFFDDWNDALANDNHTVL